MTIKSIIVSGICTLNGGKRYNKRGYRRWVRKVGRNLLGNREYSLSQKRQAYKLGCLPQTVEACGLSEANAHKFLSQRDYLQIQPKIAKENKWLKNAMASRRTARVFGKYYPTESIYCLKTDEGNRYFDCNGFEEISEEAVFARLSGKEKLNFFNPHSGSMTTCDGTEDLASLLEENLRKRTLISTGPVEGVPSVMVYVYKEAGKGLRVGGFLRREFVEGEGYTLTEQLSGPEDFDPVFGREFPKIYQAMDAYLSRKASISMVAFEFKMVDGNVKLARIVRKPSYPIRCGFPQELVPQLHRVVRRRILTWRRRKKKRLSKRIAAGVMALRELKLISWGFTTGNAKKWLLNVYVDNKRMCYVPRRERRLAHRQGFTVQTLREQGGKPDTLSEKEFLALLPLNGIYQKWLANVVNLFYIFKPFRNRFPDFLYHVMYRDGAQLFIPLAETGEQEDYYGHIVELVRTLGQIELCNSKGGTMHIFSYAEGKFYKEQREVTPEYIEKTVRRIRKEFLVIHNRFRKKDVGNTGDIRLRLYVYNANGKTPKIGSAFAVVRNAWGEERRYTFDPNSGRLFNSAAPIETVPQWEEIADFIRKMCVFVPQVRFFKADMVCDGRDFLVEKLSNYPEYDEMLPMEPGLVAFFREYQKEKTEFYSRAANRRARGWDVVRRNIRKHFAGTFYPKGMVPYISVTWIRDVFKDLTTNKDCTLKRKLWAYKHGFISYRLDQYGITPENWQEYISDFEYKWLRHINPHYKAWLEDKISLKYIAQDYKAYFPEYYFHVICKNGETNVIPLIDCPQGYASEFADIIRLIKDKGSVALKPDEGSHGDGFYRCDYREGKFFLNYGEATEEDVVAVMSKEGSSYLVTEYIQMHPQLKEIYSGSVNTIRMIVFKKDGKHPQIGNAYLRIGTESTGAIDNMSAGGMFAAIDVDTGAYGGAKIFVDGDIKDSPCHPNTGTLIEGILPNWEKTKALVLEIAEAIHELEYFGFDLAVTEDGIKIPEINRYPDYPKIEKFSPLTREYLLYKLAQKKKKVFRGKAPKWTPIHLPLRDEPPKPEEQEPELMDPEGMDLELPEDEHIHGA